MLNYLLRRLNLFFITAFILTIIAFILSHWSINYSAKSGNYLVHYIDYMSAVLQGNWGLSAIDQQSVLSNGLTAFAETLELCFIAFVTSCIIALPLGMCAALNRNSVLDSLIRSCALIGLALPVFWVALLTSMLPWLLGEPLPIDGGISPIFDIPQVTGFMLIDTLLASDLYHYDAFFSRLAHLFLPALVLSFFLGTEVIRLTRHSVNIVMKSNHIKAAYTKGLSKTQIVMHHVLKNALPMIIHQLRLQSSTIISFAMVTEIVFSLPGAGNWLFVSIKQGDYVTLPAAVVIISGFLLLSNIFIDILLVLISPIKRKSLYVD